MGSNNLNDLSSQVWQRKNNIFSSVDETKLKLIALNRWMQYEIQNSPLLNRFSVSIVPNGLDVAVFKPCNASASRHFLGIKPDAKVILFVADSVTNKRKGFEKLVSALSGLRDIQNLTLLSVGRNKPCVDTNLEHIYVGHIDNDMLLSNIYNAADIFVIPSVQDNLPNTVMESIACGIPVIGFDVGGIPDMVRPGISGLLVKNDDVEDMRKNISYLLKNDDLRCSMSRNCREIAVKEFSMETQAKRYTEIYEGMFR